MKYIIKRVRLKDEEVIAKFLYEQDRDICIEALREYWSDCDFEIGEE